MTKDELLKIFDLATMQHTDYGYETLRSKVQEIAREALAEHAMQEVQRLGQEIEQEPVATLEDLEQEIYENTRQFVSRDVMEWMLKRYYTTPPQRTWVGLTEQDLDYLCNLAYTGDEEFALAVQAKLMEKNA